MLFCCDEGEEKLAEASERGEEAAETELLFEGANSSPNAGRNVVERCGRGRMVCTWRRTVGVDKSELRNNGRANWTTHANGGQHT